MADQVSPASSSSQEASETTVLDQPLNDEPSSQEDQTVPAPADDQTAQPDTKQTAQPDQTAVPTPATSDNAAASASDGAAAAASASDGAAAAASASDDAAAASAQVSRTLQHPILGEFIKAASQLVKAIQINTGYIQQCYDAFRIVQGLDGLIESTLHPHTSTLFVNTMLKIHKEVTSDVASDADDEYFETIKEDIFRYYNLEHILAVRSRYNLRSRRHATRQSYRRAYNRVAEERRRLRRQQRRRLRS